MAAPVDPNDLPSIRRAFLAKLATHGELALAAHQAGVTRQTIWKWRKADQEFDDATREALAVYCGKLGAEIHRRGHEGWMKPVFGRTGQVGECREYSDRLLLAKAARHMPSHYGRKIDVTETRKVKFPELRGLSPDVLRKVVLAVEGALASAPEAEG